MSEFLDGKVIAVTGSGRGIGRGDIGGVPPASELRTVLQYVGGGRAEARVRRARVALVAELRARARRGAARWALKGFHGTICPSRTRRRRAGVRPHLERAMLAAALAGAVSAELELRRVGVVEGRAARRRHRERAENVMR